MTSAWLDSLSEDWVSQAGSDPLQSPNHSTRTRNTANTSTPISRGNSVRIFGSVRNGQDNYILKSVLSEKSANDINIFGSRRGPSPSRRPKQGSQESSEPLSERNHSRRSLSLTSMGSVVHNLVTRSNSTSPNKNDTPEWRRRLVQGDLAYGEQRDLFTSAKVGLESMFNPPGSTILKGFHASREGDEEEEDDIFSPQYESRVRMDQAAQAQVKSGSISKPSEGIKSQQQRGIFDDTTMPSSPPVHAAQYNDRSTGVLADSTASTFSEQYLKENLRTLQEVSIPIHQRPSENELADLEEHESERQYPKDTSNQFEAVSPPNGSQIRFSIEGKSRVVSGQSVLHNESFSAILISPEKDKAGDGAVFGPLELPSGDLKRRLENLRWNQMVLAEDTGQEDVSGVISIGGDPLNVDNTEDYDRKGGFINFRRGGRSADGSFRNRVLSPPIGNDTSEMLPEESLQASTPKQFASVRIETDTVDNNHGTKAPRLSGSNSEELYSLGRQGRQHSPGKSPLKLFGPYDTFTNQTLMRRISQYEDQMSNGSRQSGDLSANFNTFSSSRSKPARSFRACMQKSDSSRQQSSSRQSSAQFGDGELDSFQFGDDVDLSRLPQQKIEPDVSHADEAEKQITPVQIGIVSSIIPTGMKQNDSHTQRMRQSSDRPSTVERGCSPADAASPISKIPILATPRRVAEIGSEGKRPRTSPSKDSTPKRRRTLHASDLAFGAELPQMSRLSSAHLDPAHASHNTGQSIFSRKRRDARDGDEFQCADPKVLAGRDILRPRTPSPSQRSLACRDDMKFKIIGKSSSATWSDSGLPEPLVPATGLVAASDRKPSIRTEDFLNEAHKIMNELRSQGAAARGGLASLEESYLETPTANEQSEYYEDSFQESTKEPFSRPPSREGGPLPRAARMQEDPELIARLKKYEERSDLGDIVLTTTRSISLAQSSIRAEREAMHAANSLLQSCTHLGQKHEMSDPPNIRISTNPERQDQILGVHDENPSQASQRSVSSGPPTVSSFPTGSSRGSDTKKTIAPQTVSHLIPDQVGNMILDRDRNIWIKRRNGSGVSVPNIQSIPSAVRAPSHHSIMPSEGSEEDPFADIPDLSVDATMELHNLKPAVTSPTKFVEQPTPTLFTKANFSPTNAASSDIDAIDASNSTSNTDGNESVVEREISIDQDRLEHFPPPRKRHLAISFSSPIASIIQDFVVEDNSICQLNDDASIDDASAASIVRGRRIVSVKFGSTPKSANGGSIDKGALNGTSIRSQSAPRCSSRKFSVKGHEFVPRSVSRIDEREEDDVSQSRFATTARNQELSLIGDRSQLSQTFVPGAVDEFSELISHRPLNVNVLVTTPGPNQRADDEQLMAQCVGMLSLSPMSEFTIHQERSLAMEASYVLGDRHLVTGDNSKAVMAQSLHDLVSRLTEVEPFEPYWEDMEELDVQGKNLETLHKLDEFCPQLVSLDVTGNSLRNLSGVPASVRQLRIVSNKLSELTSWTTLANLQYLDISNNDVKTLSGLKSLVHLRGLKADNCGLENLDGLRYHDALQTLRARDNRFTTVNFDGTRLLKLVDLDLENNQITTATNLDQLTSLVTLNLRRNRLINLTAVSCGALPLVRTLNLSDNQLTTLDVHGLPALRILFADRNRLARIKGFSKTPRLDSISIREQLLDATERLDISCLYHAYEVRKLFLSGNLLDTFDPPVDFLNLQLLEMANCGLTLLPTTLGRRMPNLRKVNLNFNALTELRCLSSISRLKKLLAAGNRLARSYTAIETLATFVHLAEVDLRNNPMTQGFYPSVQLSMSVSKSSTNALTVPLPEPFTLPMAEVEQDKAYRSRLDLATGMRRRVYSQVLGDACKSLKKLDGLPMDRTLGDVRDAVWQALNAKGIFCETTQRSKKTTAKGKEGRTESFWGAEDSFA